MFYREFDMAIMVCVCDQNLALRRELVDIALCRRIVTDTCVFDFLDSRKLQQRSKQ